MKHQSEKRIIIKTILYRLLALTFTLLFSFIFTRDVGKSLGIAVFTETFQTFLYYVYENGWNGIDYGLK